MSTIVDREIRDTEATGVIESEIQLSRDERRPISRQLLADIIATRIGLKMDRAWLIVDEYCDEHEAAIPSYLSHEFNTHWPKVVGVLFAVAGLAAGWFGLKAVSAKAVSWPFFVSATLLFGFGSLLFVRSLESFQRLQRERRSR